MSKKYYESEKILTSFIEERERLIAEYGEKPMTGKEKANYIIAIGADFLNSFLAFMVLLDGFFLGALALAGIFAYMIGWWVPHKAGELLKDGVTRKIPYLLTRGRLLVAAAIISIAGITVIRLLNLEATGTTFEVAGFSEDIAMGTASAALAIVLTCIMVIIFIISLTTAQDKRNYYRPLYLSKALALVEEQELNARYHATVEEMKDEDNKPERVMIEAEKQKQSILDLIDEIAAHLKAQARAELEIYLRDPEKTSVVMSSKVG